MSNQDSAKTKALTLASYLVQLEMGQSTNPSQLLLQIESKTQMNTDHEMRVQQKRKTLALTGYLEQLEVEQSTNPSQLLLQIESTTQMNTDHEMRIQQKN
jgi:hypothetical protein